MDELPEELLVRIFNYMDRANQSSISLVNKKFSRIATSILYTNCELATGCLPKRIRRFLRTCTTAPRLATLVKHLRVGDWESSDPDVKQLAPISRKAAKAMVRMMPEWIGRPSSYSPELRRALRQSSQDAMTAATLYMLPNLKSVTFSMIAREYDEDEAGIWGFWLTFPDFADTLTMRVFDIATQPLRAHRPPLFQNLGYIFLDGSLDQVCYPAPAGWNIALLSIFLRLPALETFIGEGCRETAITDEDSTESAEWLCEESSSTVKSITLRDCKIGRQSISKILKSCRALETFKLSRHCKECSWQAEVVVPCDYSYADLHDDLARHRVSLRALHLDSKACMDRCEGQDAPVESFKMLGKLDSFEIDRDVLFGNEDPETRPLAEILPAHLERFSIYSEPEDEHPDFFRILYRALLSQRAFTAIKVLDGDVDDAEESLKDISGIEVKVMVSPTTDAYDAFIIQKAGTGDEDSVIW